LKEEALDRTMWKNRFGGGFEPVVRQNTEWMNEIQVCQAVSYLEVLRQNTMGMHYFQMLVAFHTHITVSYSIIT